MKECNICNKEKSEEEFYQTTKIKSNGEKYIYIMPYCKVCNKEKNNKWRRKHIEQTRKAVNRYYSTEGSRERNKKFREEGKFAKWQQNNPDKMKEYAEKREHKKHMINKTEWDACKQYFDNCCAYCELPFEEHKVKFHGKIGHQDFHKEHFDDKGKNDLSNCIPSCKICNSSKGTKDFEEWYQKQEFYTKERYDRINKWINEDYKHYIIKKEILPYIIKRLRNTDNNNQHFELWSKDENDEPLECLGIADKKKGLNTYIKKYYYNN